MTYSDYLQTDHWRKVSAAVKTRAGYRCELCFSPNHLEAHHKTYAHKGQELEHLNELICLCNDCHATFHRKLPKFKAPTQQDRQQQTKLFIRQSITGQVGAAYSAAKRARMDGLDRSRFLFFVRGALHRGWDNSRILKLAKTKSWPAFKSIVACDPELV